MSRIPSSASTPPAPTPPAAAEAEEAAVTEAAADTGEVGESYMQKGHPEWGVLLVCMS